MPVLLGFILGVALTILGVYEYDSSTGRAGNGLSEGAAGGKAPMVNWDVVSEDWHNFQSGVRSTTDSIERKRAFRLIAHARLFFAQRRPNRLNPPKRTGSTREAAGKTCRRQSLKPIRCERFSCLTAW